MCFRCGVKFLLGVLSFSLLKGKLSEGSCEIVCESKVKIVAYLVNYQSIYKSLVWFNFPCKKLDKVLIFSINSSSSRSKKNWSPIYHIKSVIIIFASLLSSLKTLTVWCFGVLLHSETWYLAVSQSLSGITKFISYQVSDLRRVCRCSDAGNHCGGLWFDQSELSRLMELIVALQ